MRSQHDALPLPQVKHCAKSSGCSRAAVIGRGTFGDEEEGGRRKEEGGRRKEEGGRRRGCSNVDEAGGHQFPTPARTGAFGMAPAALHTCSGLSYI